MVLTWKLRLSIHKMTMTKKNDLIHGKLVLDKHSGPSNNVFFKLLGSAYTNHHLNVRYQSSDSHKITFYLRCFILSVSIPDT